MRSTGKDDHGLFVDGDEQVNRFQEPNVHDCTRKRSLAYIFYLFIGEYSLFTIPRRTSTKNQVFFEFVNKK